MKKSFKYDVFISYKRKGGTPWAELLFLALEKIVGKKVFIDRHKLIGGTDKTWEERINDAIENSINVVVVIFPGIQDVTSDNDDFMKEIAKALKGRKKIVPFYVEDLTSLIIHSQSQYKYLPDDLKAITSTDYEDVSFDSNSDVWIKRLSDSLSTEEEVLKDYCYKVRVNALCEMSVYDEDDSSEDNDRVRMLKRNGDYTIFWVAKSNDILILRFETADGSKYKVTINTSSTPIEDSWTKDYEERFYTENANAYNGMCRIKDGIISVTVDWDSIKIFKREESYKYNLAEFERRPDIMLRPHVGDIVNSYKNIIEHE